MGIYFGTTRINSISMSLYINRIYKGSDLVFGGGGNITYKPFVVDRRGIYNLDLAVGNRGIENWRMTSLATQITNPGATSGTTADPQDAVRSSVEVTMQREYERGFRRFNVRTPMGARTKGNVDPNGTALSSASWSAGDPNLGTWNDLENIATVKSGGATLEYVFTTTGERKSVDATAATADRQQSFINFLKPWIDSKAAAGDPVQVYIYDGYQLAFHDTAQTDPAKGNLAWSGEKPDSGSSKAPWRIYNIGNNSPVELLDYIKAIETALKIHAKMEFLPLQPGDVPDTYADVSDLVKEFKFKPHMQLKQGVQNFINWYKDYYKIDE